MTETVPIHELPSQRFYFSMGILLTTTLTCEGFPDSVTEINKKLYSIIDNYYLESLSILNSSLKKERDILEEIESELQESRKYLHDLIQAREEMDENHAELSRYRQATHVSNREEHFRMKELEIEMNSVASIVMLLSLLESTLLRVSKELIESDSNLPKMHDVMNKKDNGIVKYLKYFEKYIEKQDEQFIVGTMKYQSLMFWLKVRNNIVHNNNVVTDEILADAKRLKIDISKNFHTHKFSFKHNDVMNLGNLCGLILDDCIEKGLYSHFSIEEIIAAED